MLESINRFDIQILSFKERNGARSLRLIHRPTGVAVEGVVGKDESSLAAFDRLMKELSEKVIEKPSSE